MPDTLYIEETLTDHPRVREIVKRFPRARRIPCGSYTEVFNPKAQNFRLQKQNPALILARKHQGLVLPAPAGYAVGGKRNYYFSHMLNCPYDCRYCFLQGMYRSAHYVLFVNYEAFQREMAATVDQARGETTWFFSGYDCDSLAFEPVTGFCASFLPFFREHPNAWLELRTKSTQVRALLSREVVDNVVIAFSLNPDQIARAVEHHAPSVRKRLAAMGQLQEQGWRVGLRFDPLIYQTGYRARYAQLFEQVFRSVDPARLHSVSLGPFRLPRGFFRTIKRLYPDEPLFSSPMEERDGLLCYRADLEREMIDFCTARLLRHIPARIFHPCT